MANTIQTKLTWTSGMAFNSECGNNNILIDAKVPFGKESGPTPKELVAIGIAGCTAMDIVALLKKYKQTVTHFQIETDVAQATESHPHVFKSVHLKFYMEGTIDREKAIAAVQASQTQFCGVSAMIAKTCPITYDIYVNKELINSGSAHFS